MKSHNLILNKDICIELSTKVTLPIFTRCQHNVSFVSGGLETAFVEGFLEISQTHRPIDRLDILIWYEYTFTKKSLIYFYLGILFTHLRLKMV